jgi:hypothetical protein
MENLYLVLCIILLVGCGTNKKSDVVDNDSIKEKDNKSNTLMIRKNCVIFLFPDSTEIEEMKQKYNVDALSYEICDDLFWYQGCAGIVLDSLKIVHVSCDKEFIILKNSKNVFKKYRRKSLEGDMIMFNIDKEPVFSDAIKFNIEMVKKYFDL